MQTQDLERTSEVGPKSGGCELGCKVSCPCLLPHKNWGHDITEFVAENAQALAKIQLRSYIINDSKLTYPQLTRDPPISLLFQHQLSASGPLKS